MKKNWYNLIIKPNEDIKATSRYNNKIFKKNKLYFVRRKLTDKEAKEIIKESKNNPRAFNRFFKWKLIQIEKIR